MISKPLFVLVRFRHEDGVWNASALDIPVAVFGGTFEEAESNFEEALKAHFEVLVEFNQARQTIQHLVKVAQDRGLYDRIEPREIVTKFPVIEPETPELCHA